MVSIINKYKNLTYFINKDKQDFEELDINAKEFNQIREQEKIQTKANFFEDSDSVYAKNNDKQIHVIQSNSKLKL